MPLRDGLRDIRQRRAHLRVGAKGGFQPCINALPHPRQGLLLATLCQGAIGGLRGLKFGHGLPEGVQPLPLQAAELHDARLPARERARCAACALRNVGHALRIALQAQQAQGGLNLHPRARGSVRVNVSLVDHHQIGQLHHAFFDGLQIVARVGQLQQHEHIGHARNGGFGLADAHGFNQHHVIACGLAHQHGLARFLGHAAQRAAAGAGADVSVRQAREALHARFVAQNGAARHARRRIHRQHRHAMALFNQEHAQRLDESAFAHARHTADAQAQRPPRVRQQGREQLITLRAVIGAGGLKQGDGLGDGAPLAQHVALGDVFEQHSGVHRGHMAGLSLCSQLYASPFLAPCFLRHWRTLQAARASAGNMRRPHQAASACQPEAPPGMRKAIQQVSSSQPAAKACAVRPASRNSTPCASPFSSFPGIASQFMQAPAPF